MTLVLSRKPKMCSFLEWKELKVVYKRYSFEGFLVCFLTVVIVVHVFNYV